MSKHLKFVNYTFILFPGRDYFCAGPATPASWYADLYSGADVYAPRTPSFNASLFQHEANLTIWYSSVLSLLIILSALFDS